MLRDARLWLELSLAGLLAGLFVISGAAVSAPLVLAQIVPLAWRRRYPALVLVVVALATLVHLRLGMWRVVGYLPAMLALHAAAGSGSRSVRIWLCAAAALALSISDATLRGPVEGGLISLVSLEEVTAPEAYTVPLSVAGLIAAWLVRRRDPAVSSWIGYGSALALTFLPSLVAAWNDPALLRPLLLGTAAFAATLAGARARERGLGMTIHSN
ncbi:hypothetical protein AB0K48_31210, partial [Nonomuraea sp. NPDC055795]